MATDVPGSLMTRSKRRRCRVCPFFSIGPQGLCGWHWRLVPGRTKAEVRLSYPKGARSAVFVLATWRAARMAVLACRELPERVRRGEVDRASGLVCCEQCGSLYHDHPHSVELTWLTVLCDRRFVKL